MTSSENHTAHLLEVMKSADDAFNQRDFDAVDRLHRDDMVAYISGNPQAIQGKEAHAAAMGGLLASFPDMHVNSDPYEIQFGSGDWVTVITHVTGTFTAPMTLPDGTVIQPTGKAFNIGDFVQTTKWIDDQLAVIIATWDTDLQARQLGLA